MDSRRWWSGSSANSITTSDATDPEVSLVGQFGRPYSQLGSDIRNPEGDMLNCSSDGRDLNQMAAALVQESMTLCEQTKSKVKKLQSLMAQARRTRKRILEEGLALDELQKG